MEHINELIERLTKLYDGVISGHISEWEAKAACETAKVILDCARTMATYSGEVDPIKFLKQK